MRQRGVGAGFMRYSAVGALATAAHYAVLVALVEWARWPAPLAAGLGALLGAQVAFVGNRLFTFGHRGLWLPAWWRFQATALLGGAVSVALVAAGTALGWHYLLAQALGTGVSLVLTYAVNRRWSFGAGSDAGPGV